MKIKIEKEKENPLLKRKEMIISIDYDGKATPSKAQVQEFLSKELKQEKEKIEIARILSTIGKSAGRAWVNLWKEKRVGIEKPKEAKPKKEKPVEKPKKEEKKPEEVKPKEEKKEEKPKEKPKEKEVKEVEKKKPVEKPKEE